MSDNFFDKKYVEYWKERVRNAQDGTKIPDEKILDFFISKLQIKEKDRVLDLGCGFGRLFPFLSKNTKNVWGIEVNEESLEEARKYPYENFKKGTAEKTDFESDYFDKIVSWEVYDVVEQEEALAEENRIMKKDGLFLVTGKNNNYLEDDKAAFIAERNAKLKNFPNHFTDVQKLIDQCATFGFEVVSAFGFERRGDFGELKYFDIVKSKRKQKFYQFMLFLKKIGEPEKKLPEICYEFSDLAKVRAKENNFENIREFFKWHKNKYGEEY